MTVAAGGPDLVRRRLALLTLRRRLVRLTALTWLLLGVALVAGPDEWRSSPTYTVVRDVAPLRAWGGLFVVIGAAELAALAARRRTAGQLVLGVGAAAAGAWLVSFAIAAVDGELVSVPALWLLLAGVHALLIDRPAWTRSRQ